MEKVEKILNKILPQIAVEHNFAKYDVTIEPITSDGANYTTSLYNVTVKEGANKHDLFVKVAALGDKMRVQNPKVYNTEIFVYTKLARVYEALENEHNVPQEHRLVLTKFYGCHPTIYEETIVLENLVKKGYLTYDRTKSYNWEYASSAMTELAKLHALSFAYSEQAPQKFNLVMNDLKFIWELGDNAKDHIGPVVQRAIDIVPEQAKEKLLRYFDNMEPNSYEKFLQKFNRKPVLTHGDYRPSNLMHKIYDDGKVDIKIVDFQTMQASSPVVDVLYFIICGSDGKFREQYYEKLLDHYYTELQAAMRRLHLDPEKLYPRADFDQEWREQLPFGLAIAVFSLAIVTVSSEDALKVDEELEVTALSMAKTNDRYAELLIDIVNDYIKWDII